MTKTLNQIFFPLHQNQNIFFSNIGNQNIFLEKNHNPPFKLNGRSLMFISIHKYMYKMYNVKVLGNPFDYNFGLFLLNLF